MSLHHAASFLCFCFWWARGIRQTVEGNRQVAEAEASRLASGMSTFLAHADAFLSSSEMEVQRKEVSGFSLTQDLARLGLSVDHRFRAYLLRSVLEGGIAEARREQAGSLLQQDESEAEAGALDEINGLAMEEAESIPDANSEDFAKFALRNGLQVTFDGLNFRKKKDKEEALVRIRAATDAKLKAMVDGKRSKGLGSKVRRAVKKLQALEAFNATLHRKPSQRCSSESYVTNFVKLADSVVNNDRIGKKNIVTALKNYCELMVEMDAEEVTPQFDHLEVLKGLDLITAGKAKVNSRRVNSWSRQPGAQEVGAKRSWYQRRAYLNSGGALKKQIKDDNKLHSVREILTKAFVQQGNLEKMLKEVKHLMSIDWLRASRVDQATAIGRKVWATAALTVKYLLQIGKNTISFFKNAWDGFVNFLRQKEERCQEDAHWKALSSAQKAGLPNTDDEAAGAIAKRMSRMKEAELMAEAEKVDKSLEDLQQALEEGSVDDAALSGILNKTRDDAADIEKDILQPDGPQDVAAALEGLDRLDKEVAAVEDGLCKTRINSLSRGLREGFQKALRAMKGALAVPAPQLTIRGVGNGLSDYGSGSEEVIDFRNREIAQFRWKSATIGAKTLTRASLGSYAGIGWKGYKENWTLAEAYQTGIFGSMSADLKLLGIPASLSVTVGTDADNSMSGPWVPEPNGINSVLFGAGVGGNIADMVLPFSADYGVSKYQFVSSECFPDHLSLLKYIWLPTCSQCSGSEAKANSVLRSAIHISFPVIPDMISSILAGMYEVLHGSDSRTRCSMASLNYQNNVTLLAQRAGRVIFDNAKLIESLEFKAEALRYKIRIALSYNPEMLQSSEWSGVLRSMSQVVDICPKFPSSLSLGDAAVLEQSGEQDLNELCELYGLHKKCKLSKRKWKKVSRIDLYYKLNRTLEERDRVAFEEADIGDSMMEASTAQAQGAAETPSTGLDVARKLRNLSTKELVSICKKNGINPIQWMQNTTRSISCQLFNSNCAVWDREMLAFKIVDRIMHLGTQASSKMNPFGECSTDDDCTWLPNMTCYPVVGSNSRCGCQTDTCYVLQEKEVNDFRPNCKREASAAGPARRVASAVRSSYVSAKVSVGQMIARLAQLGDD
eukprot:TRINITY_DN5613_c0_g1_i3.p1 TRINITY_DN5613_c0_g1~~TRINITY_DN5613_c0_g1_i3.p1  ORF type:complete len:1124 (-),score=231.17 TRINITY_DN5613_c0_g1_i3:202-3573(-)